MSARQSASLKLHPSVRDYAAVLLECATNHHHVRIHQERQVVRYVAWRAGAPLTSKPDLSLPGVSQADGTGGGMRYVFVSGTVSYEVDDPHVCSDEGNDCEPTLTVSETGRPASTEMCRRVPR